MTRVTFNVVKRWEKAAKPARCRSADDRPLLLRWSGGSPRVTRKRVEPDVLETLMEYIEVSGHKQIVFKSDQQNPVNSVQRELAVRRPEMKLENNPRYHSAADGMVENAVQRVMRLTRLAQVLLFLVFAYLWCEIVSRSWFFAVALHHGFFRCCCG